MKVLFINKKTNDQADSERRFDRRHFLCTTEEEVPSGSGRFLSFNETMELLVVWGHQTAAGYLKMLQQASLLIEGLCLQVDEWVFQQDNADVHNVCLTKPPYYVSLTLNTKE